MHDAYAQDSQECLHGKGEDVVLGSHESEQVHAHEHDVHGHDQSDDVAVGTSVTGDHGGGIAGVVGEIATSGGDSDSGSG